MGQECGSCVSMCADDSNVCVICPAHHLPRVVVFVVVVFVVVIVVTAWLDPSRVGVAASVPSTVAGLRSPLAARSQVHDALQ